MESWSQAHLYRPRTPSLATTCRATCAAPCARRRSVMCAPVLAELERARCMPPYGQNSTDSDMKRPLRTHRPGGAPSSAICRVFITLNGYKHVVRPCAAHICSAVGPLQACIKQTTWLENTSKERAEKSAAPTTKNFVLLSLRWAKMLSLLN